MHVRRPTSRSRRAGDRASFVVSAAALAALVLVVPGSVAGQSDDSGDTATGDAMPVADGTPTVPGESEQPVGPTDDPSEPADGAPQDWDCGAGTALAGPNCGVWWGIYTKPPEGSGDWYQGLTDLEGSVDRKFDLVYRYYDWNDTVPDAHQIRAATEGRMLRINITARDFSTGGFTPWSEIADGSADEQIRTTARNLKAAPSLVFLSFNQEPEPFVGTYGTVQDFAGAWQRMHRVFEQEGVTNVIWTWTVTGSSSRYAMYLDGLYPGDRYVDWVSYDPYNFYACHGAPWESFDQTISGFYDWAMANGFGDKPFMLSEYGSTRDLRDPERRAGWFGESVKALQDHPNIKAVLYFNSSDEGPLGQCDVRLGGDSSTMGAFKQMGRHPFLNQPLPIGKGGE